jgi:hypothetical protein
MAMAVSGFLAITLLFMHRYFSAVKGASDVMMGMASALFWLVFAGAGWVASAGDVTNINFYLAFAGIGMMIATLISALNVKPTQEAKQEKQSGSPEERGMAGMRKRMGWRQLPRRR